MIGRTISHYQIVEKLGEGGMGAVYIAEDTLLGRRVAIKTLTTRGPDNQHFRTRFLREARAVSALSHPHIAHIYDYGETEDDEPYIVMELIKGRTLGDLMAKEALTIPRAIEIVKQVAEALGEAHRNGIVHRDIKPSNVAINERGNVKVLDFGLAKQLDIGAGNTDVPLAGAGVGCRCCEAEATLAAEIGESDLITRSTVRLRREDALYLHPEQIAAVLPQSGRITRDLSTLIKISSEVGALHSVSELQNYLLETIREVIPAERVAIALAAPDTEQFASVAGWTTLKGADDSIRLSRTITGQVQREGVALLSNDLFQNEGLAQRPSLVEAKVCSVLCVPLIVFRKTLGVVYLDTSNQSSRFNENDLQLLTAIAGIAAIAFENVRHVESLQDENRRLQEEIKIDHQMVGDSQPLRAVLQFIAKVAPADSTVLVRGESGTGKELAARAIHLNSPRASKPFIAINCATLTEGLIESELFGHEKGAFTGAIALKRGKLELADGGTIFLDEVAELTPLIQAKLLRVLQEREFERIGGTRSIKVDVRVITATNQSLEQAIKDKKFREDLYYRLNVVSVVMPALRERREDIPLLANYFLSVYSKKCKRKVRGLADEARRLLQHYDWPGNVRELENAIERAVVLGGDDLITVDDLPERLLESATPESATGYHQAVAEAKKQLIIGAVRQANGNYTQAAKALGIHPNNLHRLIKTLNVKSAI